VPRKPYGTQGGYTAPASLLCGGLRVAHEQGWQRVRDGAMTGIERALAAKVRTANPTSPLPPNAPRFGSVAVAAVAACAFMWLGVVALLAARWVVSC